MIEVQSPATAIIQFIRIQISTNLPDACLTFVYLNKMVKLSSKRIVSDLAQPLTEDQLTEIRVCYEMIQNQMSQFLKQKNTLCLHCSYLRTSRQVKELVQSIDKKKNVEYNNVNNNVNFSSLRMQVFLEICQLAKYLHDNKLCQFETRTLLSIHPHQRATILLQLIPQHELKKEAEQLLLQGLDRIKYQEGSIKKEEPSKDHP